MNSPFLPRILWVRVALLSLGGFFEFYDLFFTGYVAPGLVRSGILTATTPGLFGGSGIASFVAALFFGLFIGTALFGFLADRFGRRAIFTVSLLWYSTACVFMAFQNDAFGLNLCRFIAGIGLGVEMVTIDTYVAELVPRHLRGRAFALNYTIQFCAVPIVALLAWRLVPMAPLGLDGWRWVVLIGALGALFVWVIRLGIPESPRWLAEHGRIQELKLSSESDIHRELLEGLNGSPVKSMWRHFPELWRHPYLSRTVMLVVFHIFQTVGYYGFSNWVPTLLIKQGITVTTSLQYTFLIALAAPFGPILFAAFADKIERKWLIVSSAASVGAFGLLFGQAANAVLLIVLGMAITLSNNVMSFAFHAYQSELYPTRMRAMAVGFVYSWSRLSAVFSAFVIAFILERFGASAVFVFIAGAMLVVVLCIGSLGPRTNNRTLESISR